MAVLGVLINVGGSTNMDQEGGGCKQKKSRGKYWDGNDDAWDDSHRNILPLMVIRRLSE